MAGSFVLLVALFAISVASLGPKPPRIRPEHLPTYQSPIDGVLNGSDFSAWIASQAASGSNVVALEEGQYSVNSPDLNLWSYINLVDLHDVTVWMDGVNMSLPDNTIRAFNIDSCSNLTTFGPTVWWDVPGFSQATITAVTPSADNSSYEIEFHLDGYNSTFLFSDGQLNAEYISPLTGRLEAGPGWSNVGASVTPTGAPNTFSFNFNEFVYFAPQVGYKLVSRGEFLFCNLVANSNHTTINDFTLLNCGGYGYFSTSSRRTTWDSFSLKPADFPPPGGTMLPARSGSADGLHSQGDFVGPVIDSCFLTALDDDCIAIGGDKGDISSISGSTMVGTSNTFTGAVLQFYTNGSLTPQGRATVVGSDNSDPGTQSAGLTLDQIPAGVIAGGSIYNVLNRQSSGFVIRNTQTGGNRGRGAIIKASNGPEYSGWGDAGYVHNITLINNTIRDCGYLDKAGAAFDLHGDTGKEAQDDPADPPMNGNSNIRISGLTISGTGGGGNFAVGGAENVHIRGVVIENLNTLNVTLWETFPAVVNFQNAQLVGNVSICIKGASDKPGFQPMMIYGNVTGAPSSINQC